MLLQASLPDGPCWKCSFPMTPHVRPYVGRLVGRSVYHNFLKGREVTP